MMAGKHFLKREKSVSVQCQMLRGTQKVTKCHQLGQASLGHFFLIARYGLNLMLPTGSCVEHVVPSWCHCWGGGVGVEPSGGGVWLEEGGLGVACFLLVFLFIFCLDSTATGKALVQVPGTYR